MATESGHHSSFSYMGQDGAFHLNGAAFYNDAEEDISQELEALDGVAQPPFGILFRMGRQRVVDPAWPAFFFEGSQDCLLIYGLPLEAFNALPIEPENTFLCVPVWRARTFLALALELTATPHELATQAVRNRLTVHCKGLEKIGRSSLFGEDVVGAEAAFRRVVELMPDRAAAHFHLGLARMFQEKLEPALEEFESAVDLGARRGEDVSYYMLPLLDTLKMLDRNAEAVERGKAFLERSGGADPGVVERIRALIEKRP